MLGGESTSEVSTSLAETSHELLEVLGLMDSDCCVVCKEEVTQTFQPDLGICFKSGEVEELSIRSGSEVDALCGRMEDVSA